MSVRKTSRSILAMILLLSLFVTSLVLAPVSASAGISIPMKVTTSNMKIPTGSYAKGKGITVGGHVEVNYGKIYKVIATLKNTKTGKTVYSSSFKPNLREINLGTYIGKKFDLKKLATGSYRYKVTVYTEYKTKTKTTVVANSAFKIVNKKPVLKLRYEEHPSRLERGNSGRFAGTISTTVGVVTYVYAYIEDSDGDIVMSTTYKPNKQELNIRSTINKDFPMAILPIGTYYYTVIARAKGNGITVQDVLVDAARIRVIK